VLNIRSSYVGHKMSHTVARSQSVVQKESARLASGQRLTSSADNSAGKAVETNLSARTRSRRVAKRNTQYARNMCRVAQGGLSQIEESLLRLQTLATQSANESITDKERAYIQTEVDGLLEGIDQIAFTSKLEATQPLLHQVPVDIGFVIDTSGSMPPFINAVKTQIANFADNVVDKGFNVAFGLASANDRSDAFGDDQDATIKHANIGSPSFKEELNSLPTQGARMDLYSSMINAGVTDHPGQVDPDKFGWRDGANKFMVVVTDTNAQERPGMLPGDPDQATVAGQLKGAEITVHVVGPNNATTYQTIVDTTEGTYGRINPDEPGETVVGAMSQALTAIELAIEEKLESISQYVFQTGIDATAEDRVESDIALDVTKLGLLIEDLDVSTQTNAQQAMDDLLIAFDKFNEASTTYAVLENKFDRLIDNTDRMIESEVHSIAQIKDTDFAESSTQLAMAKIRNETAMNVLKLYGEMRTRLVNNLLDTMTRSVRGGLYSGLG
jgi:flagellin-like hook-associated protein FlgL